MDYLNENNPFAAQWLRNLIAAGHLPPGHVDERSIEDVTPNDLRGYRHHHFFAGLGIWPLALQLAGWGDRQVWTASCPCQPFSEAGQGAGFDDKRHLWPHLFWLISQCRPASVLGEQVASKRAGAWIDLVQDDLEGVDYAIGAVPFAAGSVGAVHIRERTYWCAHAHQHRGGREAAATCHPRAQAHRSTNRPGGHRGLPGRARPGVEWIPCLDGKSRPIEPGVRAVCDEHPGRVEQLRAYGNALDAEAARVFIECVMECTP